MSALIGHAKAARILAESFSTFGKDGFSAAGQVASMMACAYHDAADRMEQAMREEATGLATAREIDTP